MSFDPELAFACGVSQQDLLLCVPCMLCQDGVNLMHKPEMVQPDNLQAVLLCIILRLSSISSFHPCPDAHSTCRLIFTACHAARMNSHGCRPRMRKFLSKTHLQACPGPTCISGQACTQSWSVAPQQSLPDRLTWNTRVGDARSSCR